MKGQSLVGLLLLALAACGGNSGNEPQTNDNTQDSSLNENVPEPTPSTNTEFATNTQTVVPSEPPFGGTIFIAPDIITEADPSTFQSITYQGIGERVMYDRRAGWITATPHLFQATYNDTLSIEIQVNPEFSESEATSEAERYAWLFGQLPTLLRKNVDTSWIHRGINSWGGGNRNH